MCIFTDQTHRNRSLIVVWLTIIHGFITLHEVMWTPLRHTIRSVVISENERQHKRKVNGIGQTVTSYSSSIFNRYNQQILRSSCVVTSLWFSLYKRTLSLSNGKIHRNNRNQHRGNLILKNWKYTCGILKAYKNGKLLIFTFVIIYLCEKFKLRKTAKKLNCRDNKEHSGLGRRLSSVK